MKDYRKAKRRADVSIGESVRTIRELQELSQNGSAAEAPTKAHTYRSSDLDDRNAG
jgi:hypothetical protein